MELKDGFKLEIKEHLLGGKERAETVRGLLEKIPISLRGDGQAYVYSRETTGYKNSLEIHLTYGLMVVEGLEDLHESGYSFDYVAWGRRWEAKQSPPSCVSVKKDQELYLRISNAVSGSMR